MSYTDQPTDTVSITVTVPGDVGPTSDWHLQNVEVKPDEKTGQQVFFDGIYHIPEIPKVEFIFHLIFLDNPPTEEFGASAGDSSDAGLGETYTGFQFGKYTFDASMTQIDFELLDFSQGDEGIVGMRVSPHFTYAGVREPNCA